MIRRPPRSTQSRSSAASDVYKRQSLDGVNLIKDDQLALENPTNLHSALPQRLHYVRHHALGHLDLMDRTRALLDNANLSSIATRSVSEQQSPTYRDALWFLRVGE